MECALKPCERAMMSREREIVKERQFKEMNAKVGERGESESQSQEVCGLSSSTLLGPCLQVSPLPRGTNVCHSPQKRFLQHFPNIF